MALLITIVGFHHVGAAQMSVDVDGSFSFEDLTVGEWLRTVNKDLVRYASEFDEYGFGNVGILLQAEEQDLIECFDELKVKKPHRRLLLKAWEGLAKFGEQHRQGKVRVAEEPPQTPEATKKVEADPKPAKSDRKAAKEAAKAAKTAAKAKATKMTPSAALAVDLTPRPHVHIITNAKKIVSDQTITRGLDWSSVPEVAKLKSRALSKSWKDWRPKRGMFGVLVHRFDSGGEQLLMFGKGIMETNMETKNIHEKIEKLEKNEIYYCIMKSNGAFRVLGDLHEAARFEATRHRVMLIGVFPSLHSREAKIFMKLGIRELNEVTSVSVHTNKHALISSTQYRAGTNMYILQVPL
jgi:hypothetical protein